MVGMNLVWVVASVPVVFVLTILLMAMGIDNVWAFSIALMFGVIGPNPAAVGIHNFANQLVKEERVEFSLFWSGLRSYWRRATVLTGIGAGGLGLLGVNLYFYWVNTAPPIRYIAVLWVYAIIFWSTMILFFNPLLIEQEDKSLKLILRNAFLLALDNFFPTLAIFIILLVLSAISIGVTLLVALVGGAFAADLATRMTLTYLDKYRARLPRRGSDADQAPQN